MVSTLHICVLLMILATRIFFKDDGYAQFMYYLNIQMNMSLIMVIHFPTVSLLWITKLSWKSFVIKDTTL